MTETPQGNFADIALDETNPLFVGLSPDRQSLFLRYRSERDRLVADIQSAATKGGLQVAHGTSSNYLQSILEKGLGAVVPAGALARSKSLTVASMPDGLVAAHLFAKGLKGDMLSTQRQEVDPNGDILKRYTELSPRIPEGALRAQIERYFTRRAIEVGPDYEAAYPVLLVLSTEEADTFVNNPNVPSERVFSNILGADKISKILVPERNIEETNAIVAKFALQATVGTIEPLELV